MFKFAVLGWTVRSAAGAAGLDLWNLPNTVTILRAEILEGWDMSCNNQLCCIQSLLYTTIYYQIFNSYVI